MQILQNKREIRFAGVITLALGHRARPGIEQKGPVKRLPVVVAGCAKTQWSSQYEQRWRVRPVTMMNINQGRVEGREIRAPLEECAFECLKRCVKAESTHYNNHGCDLRPP